MTFDDIFDFCDYLAVDSDIQTYQLALEKLRNGVS